MPWLITTPAWPALASHLSTVGARVATDPAVATAVAAGVVTAAGMLVLCLRVRPRQRDRAA